MLNINDVTRIYLGVQGENAAQTITIDVRPWLVAHPQGSVSIWHKRNGDAVPSATGAVFDSDEGTIAWTPTSTDTYVSGEGEAEIRLTENTIIKKSRSVLTGVSPSVTGAGVPLGSSWQDYIDEVDRIKALAVAAAEDAEDSAEDSEAYAIGKRGGEDVDSDDPAYHNNSLYYEQQAAQYATDAENAKDAILNMTVVAQKLPEGSDPTASYSAGVMTLGLVTGDHARLTSETEQYQLSNSGTVVPSGTWLNSRPDQVQGNFLWIKRTRIWNNNPNETTVTYESYYTAVDGSSATVEWDETPTQGSQKAVRSGGIYTALQTKVDKVDGKGLSANDYSDAEKTKLAGIENGATANVVSDSLNNSSTTDALSAAKGKYLNEEIQKRGTTVNGQGPDENGDYKVDTVEFARQIVTDQEQESVGEYIFRTTGGDASLSDGPAKLISIMGRRIHAGFVEEQLTMTVTPAAREEGEESITATIDRDTFVAYVATSGTTTLTYTSSWSADPALYGVTVSGTPISGDVITIVYVKENRGTITQSDPQSFISTGWNLYDHTNGYARVKKYSDTYGYAIDGTYTSIAFAETPTGTTTSITPDADGLFQISKDGYIIVTGGNNTDTAIWPTWSDWTEGYEGSWAAYSETEVDLSDIMDNFPYGLLQAGAVADEINFSMMKATSRIERLSYTAENLAAAIASGRTWEADTNYIYLERAIPIEYAIENEDGDYTASDHGLEIITGSSVAVYVKTLYGENIVEKITHDFPTRFTNDEAEMQAAEEALAIVVNGNTAPKALTTGQYLFLKNHSTLPSGGYHVTTNIANGETITSSNVTADADGIANALNGKFTELGASKIQTGTVMSNAMSDITVGGGNMRYKDVALTGFTSAPIVQATTINNNTGTYGNVNSFVSNVTSTSFRLIFAANINNGTIGSTWIAIGN